MKKHLTRCNDCKTKFLMEDAKWCRHYIQNDGVIGTKECPNCKRCICHGDDRKTIEQRFERNIAIGKFVPSKIKGCDWQCHTIKEVET